MLYAAYSESWNLVVRMYKIFCTACLLHPKHATAARFISVMSVYTFATGTPLNSAVIANGVAPMKDNE